MIAAKRRLSLTGALRPHFPGSTNEAASLAPIKSLPARFYDLLLTTLAELISEEALPTKSISEQIGMGQAAVFA